ncbi:hypothetical protein L1987_20953 [Smallanthus sonchifolius]|uniref:Uncharacterized protein n=1 Tax=Smallanthus sonchifolius TaxID=185202 RepID=A0ACB9ITI0_9ASTR|nr:hypothetical protein L1987_20953 [Smallanthus sonchifolius]
MGKNDMAVQPFQVDHESFDILCRPCVITEDFEPLVLEKGKPIKKPLEGCMVAPDNHKSMKNQVQEIAADCDQLPERFIRKDVEEYGAGLNQLLALGAAFRQLTMELKVPFWIFFNLSAEEKKKCLRKEDDVEGYGTDMVFPHYKTLDWTDRLHLTVLPQDQQRLQFWPQNLTHFQGSC